MFFTQRTVAKASQSRHLFNNICYFFRQCQALVSDKNVVCLPSYLDGSDDKTLQEIDEHFKLYEDFVSEFEEKEFMKDIDPILKRRRYEKNHWDDAIIGYKETEISKWSDPNQKVLERLRSFAFPTTCSLIRPVHVLDLSKDGYIKPHIDSIRFCGDTIAGISLLSSCVMRLVNQDNKRKFVDVFVPRRSLYIMKALARYNYTHEILESTVSYFKGKQIVRDRRISVICRNEPTETEQ